MSGALASALYEGAVRHHRHRPAEHAFRYRMFQPYLDLAELEQVFARRWLWSVGRRNIAAFHRGDFHGDASMPLDGAIRRTVAGRLGRMPDGPIRMLAHLRYLGHAFNPVAIYYGFLADGRTLDWIVADITNTPWNERHAYVLPVSEATARHGMLQWDFAKAFHVSPFMAMDRRYAWRFSVPGDALRVHMAVSDDAATPEFDATLSLRRRPLDGPHLARALLRYPAMCTTVVAAIYWQALRLWCKRIPFQPHPDSMTDP